MAPYPRGVVFLPKYVILWRSLLDGLSGSFSRRLSPPSPICTLAVIVKVREGLLHYSDPSLPARVLAGPGNLMIGLVTLGIQSELRPALYPGSKIRKGTILNRCTLWHKGLYFPSTTSPIFGKPNRTQSKPGRTRMKQ